MLGWTIVGMAAIVNVGLLIGSLGSLVSCDRSEFEQFEGIE